MRKNRHVFVRPATASDTQMYFSWAKENDDKNGFDPEVARFPSSVTFCAYDQDGPLAYQTYQRPIVLESLAPRPGANALQTANAIRELTQNAISQAHIIGAGEVWFLGTDAETDEFAENHIFERLPYPVFRVKLRDLVKD